MNLLEELVEKARQLPAAEREILADSLLESLDREQLTEVDQAWLKEADARYLRFQKGEGGLHAAENVLRELRGTPK